MAAKEPRQGQIAQARAGLENQPAVLLIRIPGLAVGEQGRAEFFRTRLYNLERRTLLTRDHARNAWFENPGFLMGDLAELGAQITVMVARDRRDKREGGFFDHIGGVKPPAKAGFQQHIIGRDFSEGEKRRRRGDFKKCDGFIAVGRFDAPQVIRQGLFADLLRAMRPGQGDALMEAHQMR